MKVYIVEVYATDCYEGTCLLHQLFCNSREVALRELANIVRNHCEDQEQDEPLPPGNEEAIDHYFKFWCPEEWYEITEEEVIE